MVGLTVAQVGDWEYAGKVLRGLVRTVPEASAVMLQEARASKERLVRNIERQVYKDWPKHSPNYHPKDPRLLIETRQYIDAIQVIALGPLMWGVGIPRRAKNHEGVSLAAIGTAHEYGAGSLPPRPHWRREATVFKGQLSKALGAYLGAKVNLSRR